MKGSSLSRGRVNAGSLAEKSEITQRDRFRLELRLGLAGYRSSPTSVPNTSKNRAFIASAMDYS
jgi:hypothetical protein